MGVIASRNCDKDDGGGNGGGSAEGGGINNDHHPIKYQIKTEQLHTSEIQHLKQQNDHIRQGSVRSRTAHPMPDSNEVDRRFARVLVSVFLFIYMNNTKTVFVRFVRT